MFDRLSENAKEVLSRARAASARHRADCIEAEHVLIGLLEVKDSRVTTILAQHDIAPEPLHAALETLLPRGDKEDDYQRPLSSASKRIMGLAMRIAADLTHSHVGTFHILSAILRDPENDARDVLTRVGVNADTLLAAMTETAPNINRSHVNLLLVSNSTMHGGGYLAHCSEDIQELLGPKKRVLFVPYALADHDGYAEKAHEAFTAMGHDLRSLHTYSDPVAGLDDGDAIFIGGGNTFRLLNALAESNLLGSIRKRAIDGMPYIGSSAGTNVATLSIRTTNDMPIVQPPSFEALQLVPFQINPHYLDPDPASSHMGETRQERILQFHEENAEPVLGLREGCMLRVNGTSMQLRGTTDARLFRRGKDPEEFHPPCDISHLLGD
jgi:dipeptidase E